MVSNSETNLYTQLTQIWLNEKLSEQILQYKEAEVKDILILVEKIDRDLEESEGEGIQEEMALISELEIDRIKFMIKDYLRIRLKKIEKFLYFLISENLNNLLSNEEIKFAIGLFRERKDYFNSNLLNKLGKQTFNWFGKNMNKDIVVKPNENNYVFAKALDNIEMAIRNPVEVQNENFYLVKNEIALIREKEVEKYLQTGKIKLI